MNFKILSCIVLVSNCLVAADTTTAVRPYLNFRSQGANAARNIVGTNGFFHKVAVETFVATPVRKAVPMQETVQTVSTQRTFQTKTSVVAQPVVEKPKSFLGKTKSYSSKNTTTVERNSAQYTKNDAVEVTSVSSPVGNYGVFSVTPAYNHSFDGDAITQSLFGWSLQSCNKLNITGSEVLNRNPKDLLADWFYLDGAYQGSISFEPVIQNAMLDLNLYFGMDKFVEGLYFRIDAPITWTKWDLGARFKTTNVGVTVQDYLYGAFIPPQGYEVTRLDAAEKFFCKKGFTQTGDAPGLVYPPTYTAPVYHALTSARFCGCTCDEAKSLVRIADIRMDLGWDFVKRDRWNMGVYARGVAPTGNRPNGRWLFEPVVGNGHYWELGGGVTANANVWRNTARDKSVNFSLDANVTHFFNALQHRVFDLKGLPLSRYMTAYRSNEPEMGPVANLTATTINSRFDLQADVVAMFTGVMGNWSADLGYNFWARTCEKISCSTWSNSCYGKSIVRNGLYAVLDDSSKWAIDPGSDVHGYDSPVSTGLLTPSEIDYSNAQAKGMSHKVFGHVSYAWMDRDMVPFIGIGGEGEFGRNEKCGSTCASTCANACSSTSCSTSSCSKSCCKFASLSQWGVWIKGGVSF